MNLPWNDMSRGAEHWIEGQDEDAKKIDVHPVMSGAKSEDEGLYIIQHNYWKKVMTEAVRKEQEKGE
jgi:benzoate/toluate 1,2-dioxygenase alpha subunit